jgi:alpha-1,2-mannosyltransferase
MAEFGGQVLRDSFGLAALAAMALLGSWLVKRVKPDVDQGDPSQPKAEVGTLAP